MATTKAKPVTPMQQRYLDAKATAPGCLLLFRMGDFYEAFHDDARIVAKTLGLSLTTRRWLPSSGGGESPMAGFPYHQIDTYVAKLVAGGHRVTLCD